MRLPSALTAPVSALTPHQRRVFFWLTTGSLLMILRSAGEARGVWPHWPIADPDTWGYLHPALAKLNGGAFEHTDGRNFVYPGFLYLLLRATADFRTITLVQHTLGLATGVLLWTAWRQWRAWFRASRLPAWADAALGLGMVACYGRSASVIHFEMQIRPEGVFPFVAAGQLCLWLEFVRAWWGDVRRPDRAAVFAGASLFAAALAYQIKPSYGLAVGVAALPVAWAVAFPWRGNRQPRRRLLGAAVVAGLAALVLFVLPERAFNKADPNTRLFLPETLLTVHATVIRDQLLADVRDHAETPFDADWLAHVADRLDHEVRVAAEPAQKPYPTLGINPDHLLYSGDSFCRWLFDNNLRRQIVAFSFYYYQRAWTHHPGAMLANVGRQLRVFYAAPCPAFWLARKLKVERYYNKTGDAFSYPDYHRQMLAYAPAAAYLDAANRLSASDVVFRLSSSMIRLNNAAAWGFLPLLGLFLAGMLAAGFLPPARRRLLWTPGAGLLLIGAVLFGNTLTVAVVHSFDLERYSFNLLLYTVLCEAAAAAWLYEFAWAWTGSEPAPTLPAPAAIPFAKPQPLPVASPATSET